MPDHYELELFVYILGLDGSPFPIDIESSKTTARLKKLILEEKPKTLKDVEANQLKLYKVCLPGDRTISGTALEAIREDNIMVFEYEVGETLKAFESYVSKSSTSGGQGKRGYFDGFGG